MMVYCNFETKEVAQFFSKKISLKIICDAHKERKKNCTRKTIFTRLRNQRNYVETEGRDQGEVPE